MRSTVITSVAFVAAVIALWSPAEGQGNAPRMPDPASLASGDFLWPKLPDKVVPFDSQPGLATEAQRHEWEAGRAAELKRLEALSHPTDVEAQRYATLATLSYEEFLTTYLTDHPEGSVQLYGAIGPVATGHVAIVEMRDGRPWIVEAMLHNGVQTMSYSDWLEGRPGEWVWHGRLKDVPGDQRAAIAGIARGELKKPYDFWNFDLSDEAGFYCSKLAWFSVWKATNLTLDDDPNPRRALWYSPKRMMHSSHIQMLFAPGRY